MNLCEKLLSDSRNSEAKEWLEAGKEEHGDRRTIGEKDYIDSVKFIDSIYDAGARKVYAVEIVTYDECENTGKLVIELPEAKEARVRVFEWNRIHAESMGFEGDKDIGQEHLFVMLD